MSSNKCLERLLKKMKSDRKRRRKRAVKQSVKYFSQELVDMLLLVLLLDEEEEIRALAARTLASYLSRKSNPFSNEIKNALNRSLEKDPSPIVFKTIEEYSKLLD
jgi:HEAT repeat protein